MLAILVHTIRQPSELPAGTKLGALEYKVKALLTKQVYEPVERLELVLLRPPIL